MRLLLLGLAACSASHVVSSDARPDAEVPDGEVPDALSVDAGVDASLDVAVDAGGLVCDLTAGELLGDGCFCEGDVVVRGDYLYHLGFSLDVFDLRSDPPRMVNRIAERGAGSALRIVADHLVAFGPGFGRDDAVIVYSLRDPTSPERVGSWGPEMRFLAQYENDLLVAMEFVDRSWALQRLDASEPVAPIVRWEAVPEGFVSAAAMDANTTFVHEQIRPPEFAPSDSLVRRFDARGMEERRASFGTALHQQSLVLAGDLYLTGALAGVVRLDSRDLSVIETYGGIGTGTFLVHDGLGVLSAPSTVFELPSLDPIEVRGESVGPDRSTGERLFQRRGGSFQEFDLRCTR
ncbi:MAG: hypothetical protein AAGE52_38810 [Myxococcota bacterium]